MPGTNTQIISATLKTYFEDYIAEQTNNKFPLTNELKWKQLDYAGQEVKYIAHTTRNVSPMFCGEDGGFAEAGAQGSVPVTVGQRKMMARIRMTSESMSDSLRSEYAYVSTRKDEMTRLVDDIGRMEEYALSSDGRGVLALVDAVSPSGSATLTVDAPGNITGDDFGNRFILPGMYVGFVNPATGALRAGIRKVVSCSSDGTSITLDAAPGGTVADSDYIVQCSDASTTDVLSTSYEHAFYGLTALLDDGTYRNNYFGIDRSQYPQYQTYVKAATGALSLDLFQQASDIVDQKLGAQIDLMTAHHSVRRLYLKLLESDRRYTASNLQRPDGGTVAFKQGDITMGEVPIKALRTHPLGMMFGFDTKGVEGCRYGSERGKWVDEDGQILIRVGYGTSARDSFEAWYRKRQQNHMRYPGKAFRFDGITGQSFVAVRDF